MSDRLEELLPGALSRHEGDDDGVAGLAAGARVRAARRARRRTAGVVVAAAIAVAAVPTALALTGSSPSVEPAPTPPTTSELAPTPTPTPDPAPGGTRVESWRNLTVSVPSGWGYGGGSDWCASSDPRPGISRPEDAVDDILCTPESSYGLHFIDGSAINWARDSGDVWQYGWDSPDQVKMYPEDAWLGHFRAGGHALMVVAPDEATARAVIGSARGISAFDANGCSPGDRDEPVGERDRWSVCRYDADGWLVQSELLTVEESEQFLTAVQAAPLQQEIEPCGEPVVPAPSGRIVVSNGSDLGSMSVVFESLCPGENGVYLSGTVRELTADVLYWVLSPGWSGGVDTSVPLPEELRQR